MIKNSSVFGTSILIASLAAGAHFTWKNWIEPIYIDARIAAFARGDEIEITPWDFWVLPENLGRVFGSGLVFYAASVALGFLIALPFSSARHAKEIFQVSSWLSLALIFSFALVGIDA